MACLFCRIEACLKRKLMSLRKPRPRYTSLACVGTTPPVASALEDLHDLGAKFEGVTEGTRALDGPPPQCRLPLPQDIEGSETLETLRARNPPRLIEKAGSDSSVPLPPLPKETLEETCNNAAYTATLGMCWTCIEPRREMVAARTIQAISVAVSTSRSYAAFIAAITAAESIALIYAEAPVPSVDDLPDRNIIRRQKNAYNKALDAAIAADAETDAAPRAWPFHFVDGIQSSASRPDEQWWL